MFSKPTLAVDIGNKNIKVVLGKYSGGNLEVMDYAILPTPEGILRDGRITNAGVIADVLRRFTEPRKLKKAGMIVTVSGTGIITRDILLPKASDEEIGKMLEFEAQQYFPVDLESYVLDFKVIEEVEMENGISDRVLLAAVPEKQLEEYVQLPGLLGLELKAVDLPANCLSKLISGGFVRHEQDNRGDYMHKSGYAVADIGSNTTGVCIFLKDHLKFNRVLMNGSRDIDQLISNRFNMDSGLAERVKRAFDPDHPEKSGLADGIEHSSMLEVFQSAAETMAQDLGRFLEFYTSRSSENRISKLLLYGGGSCQKSVDSSIGAILNIPAELAMPSDKIHIAQPEKQQRFNEDFCFLVNALGALIREAPKSAVNAYLSRISDGLSHLKIRKAV